MADDGEDRKTVPGAIIIRRVKKRGHAHAHGAWKIAYADFVTAMMAFFLLLWLLNSVTQDQLEGISDYFSPVTVSDSTSGSGAMLDGATLSLSEGARRSGTASESTVTLDLPAPSAGSGGTGDPSTADEETAAELMRQVEEEQFEKAKAQLEQAIDALPQLQTLKNALMIDNTPEGLRIQLVDSEGLALFPSGSSAPAEHTRRLLELVVGVVQNMPQFLSISGHTDATSFGGDGSYSNWELSADRANAARRVLSEFGVADARIGRVVGRAANDPLRGDDPTHPSNRRLSIILLRGTGEQAITDEMEEKLPGLRKLRERQLQEDRSQSDES